MISKVKSNRKLALVAMINLLSFAVIALILNVNGLICLMPYSVKVSILSVGLIFIFFPLALTERNKKEKETLPLEDLPCEES